MFGGYADVAGYYLETEVVGNGTENDINLPGPLPSEYLPVYVPPNPWQHCSTTAQQDFVLIAEFSEQEGPKPLITIPKGADSGFDLNEFAVRIMSVDYQTMASETFSMTEDTQIIISESRDDIYAYVHHFSLSDSQARGFVRPFCMSYVTTDHSKLISFYNEMSSEFSKVSRYLKYGNLMLFVKDMTHYLTDLQFTRERYMEREAEATGNAESDLAPKEMFLNGSEQAEDAIFRSMNLKTVDACIKEVKDVLEMASSFLTDQRLEARFRHLEEKSHEERPLSAEYPQISSSLTNGSPRHSRSWLNMRRAKSGSFSEVDSNAFSMNKDPDIYRPKLVRTINRRRFDKALRTLHELCQWGAKDGLNRLRSLHRYFCRDLATLEIERKESRLIDPPATLLTIGRNVAVNFLSNIDVESTGACWPIARESGLKSSHTSSNLLRRWLSDDTLASFNSIDSFLSCQEENTPLPLAQSSFEPSFVMGSAYVEERDSLGSFDVLSLASRDEADSGDNNSKQNVAMAADPDQISLNASDMSATESMEFDDDYDRVRKGSIVVKGDSCWRGNEETSESMREALDCADKQQRVSVISAADHVTNLVPNSPGYGILRFVCQSPFSPHIIYSLLCGRPLVIVGSSKVEREVRAAVSALWLFVPGHSSRTHMVIPWHTQPLRVVDLAKMKLVGLRRPDRRSVEHMVPRSTKRYVSIFDLEKKTLWAPAYQSGFVTGIFNKRRHIRCEKAYIAYVHSVILELASKAHVYYHSFCVNSPVLGIQRGVSHSQNLARRRELEVAEQEFLTKLKVNVQDSQIIKHFVEVVKMQQVEEIYCHSSAEKEPPCPAVKLDYSQCTLFKLAK